MHHRESMLDAFTSHKQANLAVRSAQLGCLGNRLNAERMTHRFLRVETLTATVTLRRLRSGEPEWARLSLRLPKIATIARGKNIAHGSRLTDHGHRIAAPAGLLELIAKSPELMSSKLLHL